MTHVVQPFEPVFDSRSEVLILGSIPSAASRGAGFYYGHPRNRFWPLIASLYGEAVPAGSAEKAALLLRHRLALWDTIESCDIEGSSDASARHIVPADLGRITGAAPIRLVLLNGALAGKLYRRYQQPRLGIPALVLPSTSPANAAWTAERLAEAWGGALRSAADGPAGSAGVPAGTEKSLI